MEKVVPMFLVLRPNGDPMRLSNDAYYECFAVSDPVQVKRYLEKDGWIVYSIGSLKRVEDVEITAKVELK